MKPLPRIAATLLSLLLLGAGQARAQGPDARVVPRGMLELRALGLFIHFDARFGDGRAPLGAGFEPPLQAVADRLIGTGVTTLQGELDDFFAGTQATAPGTVPQPVTAGHAELGLAADLRDVPVTLAYGLSRRLTLELTVPVERRRTDVTSNRLAGGDVGLNPDSLRNRTLLSRIGPEFEDLGRQRFLPTAGSAAGEELQRRVQALLGDTVELRLPELAVSYPGLLAIPELRALLDSTEIVALGQQVGTRGPYQLGDVQLGARYLLAGPPGFALPDTLPGRVVRATLGARVRLPTGPRSATLFLFEVPSASGHAGAGVDVTGDLASRRWWISGAAAFEVLLAADARRRDFAEGLFPDSTTVVTLRREPGARFALSLTPRYRLTREISFAAQYALAGAGATTFSGGNAEGEQVLGPFEVVEGWTAHRVGIGMGYSTLTAYAGRQALVPFEVSLLYQNTLAGTGEAPDAGMVTVAGRIFYQLIGRTPRPRPAAPDTVPPPPPAPDVPAPERPDTIPSRPPPPPPPPPPAAR
ncbi:MAG TPA: hypothetical protein VFX98_09350 [Longimicrobiaceae bacterium]|nr:hypothetical protein [Longimicrobiaceae bacterium]